MPRTRSLIPALLLAVIALIAYGSLYPFNFKPDAIDGGVLDALTRLSWARAGRGDHIANVLLYLPLGFCLYLWLDTHLRRYAAFVITVACGALLSFSIELAQVYISPRVPSLKDLALNTIGTLLGALGGLAWQGIAGLMHLPARTGRPSRDPGAALVLSAWMLFRLTPFLPQFDLAKLKTALQPLFAPRWDAPSVGIYLVCWLIVSRAVDGLVSRSRRLEVLLLVIAAVLVGRLLVANQTFVADELLALVLLLPVLVLMDRLAPAVQHAALLIGLAFVIVVEELAPFEFASTAAAFDFWPFKVWVEHGWSAAMLIDWSSLFGRLFFFIALMWLLRQAGLAIHATLVVAVGGALALEVFKLWLPDQGGSLTMPVLVLGIGLILRRFERSRPSRYTSNLISRPGRSR